MRWLSVISVAVFCAQLAASTAAQAADHEFCDRYAHEAEFQADRAREGRCWRFFDMHEARWQSRFEEHYRWCRRTDFREVERERDIRRRELHRCGV